MNLRSHLSELKSNTKDLTLAERADVSTRRAKEFEKAGDYEAASEALTEFWPDHSSVPNVTGLDERLQAELLLRAGAISNGQATATQVQPDLEAAKNLITKSIALFEKTGDRIGIAEGYGELGLCYWRGGLFCMEG